MTNEEKIQEISSEYSSEILRSGAYYGAKEMADWKDNRLKEYLSKKMKDYENDIQENSVLGSMSDKVICNVRLNTIKEIINELFK